MIYSRGEFVRIMSGSSTGNYGQIHKVGDIDKSNHPYLVATVLKDKSTIFFEANQDEIKYCEYRQIEFEDELIFYMKNVKR